MLGTNSKGPFLEKNIYSNGKIVIVIQPYLQNFAEDYHSHRVSRKRRHHTVNNIPNFHFLGIHLSICYSKLRDGRAVPVGVLLGEDPDQIWSVVAGHRVTTIRGKKQPHYCIVQPRIFIISNIPRLNIL